MARTAYINVIVQEVPEGEWAEFTALTSTDQTYRGYQGLSGIRQGRIFGYFIEDDEQQPLVDLMNAQPLTTYVRAYEVGGVEKFDPDLANYVGYFTREGKEYYVVTYQR